MNYKIPIDFKKLEDTFGNDFKAINFFIWSLYLARREKVQISVKGKMITLNPGQFIFERSWFSPRLLLTHSGTYKLLERISQVTGFLQVFKTPSYTVVTIKDYDQWIGFETGSSQVFNKKFTKKSLGNNKVNERWKDGKNERSKDMHQGENFSKSGRTDKWVGDGGKKLEDMKHLSFNIQDKMFEKQEDIKSWLDACFTDYEMGNTTTAEYLGKVEKWFNEYLNQLGSVPDDLYIKYYKNYGE